MKCKMEKNYRRYEIFRTLSKGYGEGDFTGFFPYLRADCRYVSMWVQTPLVGVEAIVNHLTGKGEAIKESGSFATCTIVELIGNMNPINCDKVHINGGEAKPGRVALWYEDGKCCMLMEQTIDDETHGVLVDLTLDDQGMVKQIDICDPELFCYEPLYECFILYVEKDGLRESESTIRVSEDYGAELNLFLGLAGIAFDQYNDTTVPMDRWCMALDYWRQFCRAESFDSAFEALAGVDYDTWTPERPEAVKWLAGKNSTVGKDRLQHAGMLSRLQEWTNLYRDNYEFVCIEGVLY